MRIGPPSTPVTPEAMTCVGALKILRRSGVHRLTLTLALTAPIIGTRRRAVLLLPRLKHDTVVSTVMSNKGLDIALNRHGAQAA